MQDLLVRALSRLTGLPNPPVSVPEVEDFGHFSTPVALQLAKERKQSPMGIAAELALGLMGDPELEGLILNAEVASPGFVNVRLTPEAHHRALARVVEAGPTVPQAHAGEKAIVESASINVAKPVHVGHLRNTALGASIARILEATGTAVTRWNYLGDWGTQFGKVVVAYRAWGSEERLAADPIGELVSLYVRFHEEAKADETLDDQARAAFRDLESGDAEVRALWQRFRDASVDAMQPLFTRLNAPFDIWDGEASLEGALEDVVAELDAAGILEESEGARVVRLDEEGVPVALIRKSDGGSLYLTRDLVLLKRRLTDYPDTRILYVVANEQALNFQQLFAIGRRLGWDVDRAEHLKYGLVLGGDGKKLSSRAGGVVTAQEVLDEADARIAAIVAERDGDVPAENVRAIATGAVVYAMTKDPRTTDIAFQWDRLLDFRGDSGPYLQYTHARLARLLGKADEVHGVSLGGLEDPRELELIRSLDQYGPAVLRAAGDLQTSHLALYLYQLASQANAYYQSVQVLKDEDLSRRDARLALLEAVRATLAAGMGLLGVEAVSSV